MSQHVQVMAEAHARSQPRFERPGTPVLRPVPHPDREHGATGDGLDFAALGDLVTSPGTAVAEHARAALTAVIAHDALVLVSPASAGAPVQISAPPGLRDRLTAIEWSRVVAAADEAREDTATRITLEDVADGLRTAAWSATSGGCTVWLIVGARGGLEIDEAADRAAMEVAMLAAARARRIDEDPPPGTLAFSRAMSLERERVRAQLSSGYAATLSGLLHTLRSANDGGSRSAPPEVSKAIDLASHALLDLETLAERHGPFGRVAVTEAFADAESEVRRVVHAVRVRVFADLDATDGAHVPQAIAQAARYLTGAAALNATRHAGADKLRLLWRLTAETLSITVADNGAGSDTEEQLEKLADVQRRLAGLDGEIELDANPHWGTTVICRLPLHDVAAPPETPASRRLEQLRDREREVLELMIAGLRNRDIADRLFISVRTVKYHVSNILQKLDVASRTEAIAVAHSAGISAPTPEPEPSAASARRT
jgi:DNA-binding CsgD family transcriptional regulator/signal transduction histidine kinase